MLPGLRLTMLAALTLALAACAQTAAPRSPDPAAQTATTQPSPSATARALAASIGPSVAEAPASPPATGSGGMALADVEVDLLRSAFENYGFVFEPTTVDEIGATRERGKKRDDDVQVAFRHLDGMIEMLSVFDHSGGERGLDEIGFTIGIFAPESQSWLLQELEAMLATPSQPAEAIKHFEHVTLSLAYATDGTESLELLVE